MPASYNPKALLLAKLDEDDLESLADFNCIGAEESDDLRYQSAHMNEFLKHYAIEEQSENLSVTYLIYHMGELVSYVTLCADSIKLSNEEKKGELLSHRESYPAIKITRIAVDARHQGQGFGELMIEFVREHCSSFGEEIGIRFITVDSFPARENFYKRMGFVRNEALKPHRNAGLISMRSNVFDVREDEQAEEKDA